MTTSAYMPDIKVEIAFDSGYSTPAASRTWTDVSSYVELAQGITISRGRQDEFATTDPNKLTLTLDNRDGRFTAGKTGGAYYPNVKIGRPIKVTSTPVGGTASIRFLGYVDDWPVEWTGTDSYAFAKISASSRMARLGFDAELPSTLVETYLAGVPMAYWTMNDPAGAVAAADRMGGDSLSPVGTGTVVAFGGDPVALNGGTSATFAPAVSPYLVDGLVGVTDAGSGVLVECFILTLDADGGGVFEIGGGLTGRLNLTVDPAGTPVATFVASGSYGSLMAISGTTPVNDGLPHHLALQMVWDGAATKALSLYVDGVVVATASVAATVASPYPEILIGNGAAFNGGHLALNADIATIADRAEAGLTGFGYETAAERIERYATFAGIDPLEIAADADTNPVAAIDTAGLTVISAMRVVEETESGVLFDGRDNTLTFHGRARRYNASSVFTFDVSLQEVEAGMAPKLDRSTLANDVTATAADGTTAEAINSASIADYGYARESIDIASTHDVAYQAAAWRVGLYGEPQPRIPSLGVDLLPLSQVRQDSLLTADISSMITLSNLPTQAPASTLTFFVEGYTETIGDMSYGFDFNVSPTMGHNVWTIEDPVYGAFDTYGLAY